MALIGASLTSFHLPFLVPDQKILTLAGPATSESWRAVHILSPGCGCSRKVIDHLLVRGPLKGVNEEVLLVNGMGPDPAGSEEKFKKLREMGFLVNRVEAGDLAAKYGLHGVPLLLCMNPHGKLAYLGGYGPARNQLQDEDIFRQLSAGATPTAFPVVGCALSASLKARLDPLGMKYK